MTVKESLIQDINRMITIARRGKEGRPKIALQYYKEEQIKNLTQKELKTLLTELKSKHTTEIETE